MKTFGQFICMSGKNNFFVLLDKSKIIMLGHVCFLCCWLLQGLCYCKLMSKRLMCNGEIVAVVGTSYHDQLPCIPQ